MWRKSGDDVCSAVALLPNLMHWSKGGLVFGELGENLEKLENLTKARWLNYRHNIHNTLITLCLINVIHHLSYIWDIMYTYIYILYVWTMFLKQSMHEYNWIYRTLLQVPRYAENCWPPSGSARYNDGVRGNTQTKKLLLVHLLLWLRTFQQNCDLDFNASAWFRWFQTSWTVDIRMAFISFFKLASRHPRIFSGWGWSFILATVIFSAKMRLKDRFPSQLVVEEWFQASQTRVKTQQLMSSLYLQSQTKGSRQQQQQHDFVLNTVFRLISPKALKVDLSMEIPWSFSPNGLIVRLWSWEWSRSSQLWTIQSISHVTFSCKDQGF